MDRRGGRSAAVDDPGFAACFCVGVGYRSGAGQGDLLYLPRTVYGAVDRRTDDHVQADQNRA